MKNVLIIGANSAIAEACGRLFAERGDALFLVSRNAERLESLASDLKVRGAAATHTLALDLADLTRHQELVDSVKAVFPQTDVLLIAHGILPNQDECQASTEKMLDSMAVNFLSPVSLLNLWANEFEVQKKGAIAVISSVAGDRGRQSNYIYGAAKGGLSTFLEGLRNRMFKHGISVISIKPGFVDTPMTAEFEKGALWAKPEQVAKGILHAIDKGGDNVYLPSFWKLIMMIIIHIPEKIFKKLSL